MKAASINYAVTAESHYPPPFNGNEASVAGLFGLTIKIVITSAHTG